MATGRRRCLFKQTQTERLNDHADSSHSRCLEAAALWPRERESGRARVKGGRCCGLPCLHLRSREKRRTRFVFKCDLNICSPTKPKPTERRIHSGRLLCFSRHLKRVLPFAPMSSQLNISTRTESSADLKVGLCFWKVVVSLDYILNIIAHIFWTNFC